MPDAVDFTPNTGQPLFRIGLLTDIHIGNASLLERQKKAFADMDALGLRMLCLMGDIVDNALEHQYAMARTLIGGLNTPILAITGNHELFPLTMPVETCLANFRQSFAQPRHFTARRYDPYLFVFLGIDQRMPSLPKNRRDTGISQEQLDWFRRTLHQHADLPTVVISHAPFEQTVADSDHFPLADSASLCDILSNAPQVFLWLSGHTHLPDVHRGENLLTAVEPVPGRFFVHVPSLADYYVHVVNGQRQFFRGLPLQTRLLACYPDRIDVETYDLEAQTVKHFLTVPAPVLHRHAAA